LPIALACKFAPGREVLSFENGVDAYSAASLTYSPLPTGQAAHSSLSAVIRSEICASVWTGEGVKRMRSVARGPGG
jgi:hypothetical protein